jgi:hypothetical protein
MVVVDVELVNHMLVDSSLDVVEHSLKIINQFYFDIKNNSQTNLVVVIDH